MYGLSPIAPKPYWWQAKINRNGQCVTREGAFNTEYAHKVTDHVKMLAEGWGVPVMELTIHSVDDDGTVGPALMTLGESGIAQYNARPKWGNNSHTCEYPRPQEFGTTYRTPTFATYNPEVTKK